MYAKLFNSIQKDLNVKIKNCLYEYDDANDYTYACYASITKAIYINAPFFNKLTPTIQRFILCHEIRHYLQNIMDDVKKTVQNCAQKLNLTPNEAIEHDADMFALEYIAKNNCAACLTELINFKSEKISGGYISKKEIYP